MLPREIMRPVPSNRRVLISLYTTCQRKMLFYRVSYIFTSFFPRQIDGAHRSMSNFAPGHLMSGLAQPCLHADWLIPLLGWRLNRELTLSQVQFEPRKTFYQKSEIEIPLKSEKGQTTVKFTQVKVFSPGFST